MNILITGADGQLGSSLQRLCALAPDGNSYFFIDIGDLDITDSDAVDRFFARNSYDVVVNCAAYTNVDAAENDALAAEKVNHMAVAYLAAAVKKTDATLIHISTDYVFGGTTCNIPCDESATENPTGVYGATKLAGEKAILASGCRYIIIRTAWLYSEYGKNFAKTMLSLIPSKPTLNVVFDQAGTPTYAADLAGAILTIVRTPSALGKQGIYHYSNEGVCSWYDFAKEIADMIGNTSCDIQPCHSSEFPSRVVRPSYSVLDKTKIKSTFDLKIPYWKDSLRLCLANIRHMQTV